MAAAPRSAPTSSESPTLRIGAVRSLLSQEFPQISISKIRYLESKGLISPSRTRSGYRLFNDADLERLRLILELQRDHYLPLRVIRDEITASSGRGRRRSLVSSTAESELDLAELCRRSQLAPALVHELEEQGLLRSRQVSGRSVYPESDAEIARICAGIVARGVDARHLRALRHAAERIAGLLAQLAAPALHARSSENRRAALADLETLESQSEQLVHLLVRRELQEAVSR
jgi:DNA-binding transcriptional MerR regulator